MKKVRWSSDARAALDKTGNYIMLKFGINAKMKFKKEVKRVNDLLKANPYLGPEEPLLSDLPITYRSIVVGSQNKIVYRVTDDYIEISDFWDTRREPKAQADQLKTKN